MKEFMFLTRTTVKKADRVKWWIDGDLVSPVRFIAENFSEALEKFVEFVEEKSYISISPTALKKKTGMYVDTKDGKSQQVGYVITGKYSFYINNGGIVDKYIDLGVEILEVNYLKF